MDPRESRNARRRANANAKRDAQAAFEPDTAPPAPRPAPKAKVTSSSSRRTSRQTAVRDRLNVSLDEARRLKRALRAVENGAPDDLDDDDRDAYLDDDEMDAGGARGIQDADDRDADDLDDLDASEDDDSDDAADADDDDDDDDADDEDDEDDGLDNEAFDDDLDNSFAPFPSAPINTEERAFTNALYRDMPAMPQAKKVKVSGWIDLGQTRDPRTGKRLYPQYVGWAIRVRKDLPLEWLEAAQDLQQRVIDARKRGGDMKKARIPAATIRTLVGRACVAWNFPDDFGRPLARPPHGVGELNNELLAATFATAMRAMRGPKGSTRR